MSRPRTKSSCRAAGFFGFRTPALPFSAYLSWYTGQPEGSYEQRARAVRSGLASAMEAPATREAIYLASPTLLGAWDGLRGDLESDDATAVVRSLMRYFARMCGRATPFGLFAGHGVGAWGERSDMTLGPRDSHRRHTRPDSAFLSRFGRAMQAAPELRSSLLWWPNWSLYPVPGGYKYFKRGPSDAGRGHRLMLVEGDEYLSVALDAAAEGITIAALAAVLGAVDPAEGMSATEAIKYIEALIDAEVLTSRQLPISSGPAPVDHFLAHLPKGESHSATVTGLEHLSQALREIDRRGVGVTPEVYTGLHASIAHLPGEPKLEELYHVDLHLTPEAATLGPHVRRELERAVELLRRLSPPHENPLRDFVGRFKERYQDQAVPLMVALDPEYGVGLDAPTVSSAGLPCPLLTALPLGDTSGVREFKLTRRDERLLARLRALQAGTLELLLTDKDIEELADAQEARLPDSFSLSAAVSASSAESVDAGRFDLVVTALIGPSGALLLGRFCYLDEKLRALVEGYLREEEALVPHAIFAEVVHLPEGRVANVVARPQLRKHEIVLHGRSSAREAVQIPVSDLWVREAGGRIQLFSRSLGKEVIPRITNAHDHIATAEVSVYRFLAQLLHQDAGWMGFDWGPLRHFTHFLPRVRHGKIVLRRAEWRVDRHEIAELSEGGDAARFDRARRWQRSRAVPRFVELVDGEHRLLIDFENPLSIDAFVHLVRQRQDCTLSELFPAPENLVVSGADGRYTHELVVPFLRRDDAPAAPIPSRGQPTEVIRAAVPATFMPGSEWLYAKLYGSVRGLEELLIDTLRPLIARWRRTRAVDRWFFVRYGDPDLHLRVRFHGVPSVLLSKVLPELSAAMRAALDKGLIRGMSVDSYERELSRYGGSAGIELAEQIFWADSDAVLEIAAGLAGEEDRWKLCARGVDQLMDDFELSLEEKRVLMGELRARYRSEFSASAPLARALGATFRSKSDALFAVLDRANDGDSTLTRGLRSLEKRSVRIKPAAAALRAAERGGMLSETVRSIVASLLHMHTNRSLPVRARAHELVLYDFLFRVYDSGVARHRSSPRSHPGDVP